MTPSRPQRAVGTGRMTRERDHEMRRERFLETVIAYFLAATRTRRTRLRGQLARDSRGLSPDALVTLLETTRHRAKGRG
jgi:hypothetical protein